MDPNHQSQQSAKVPVLGESKAVSEKTEDSGQDISTEGGLPVSDPLIYLSDFENGVESNVDDSSSSSSNLRAPSTGSSLKKCGENISRGSSPSTSSSHSGTSTAESQMKSHHLPRPLEAPNQLHYIRNEEAQQSRHSTEDVDPNTQSVGTTALDVQLVEAPYDFHIVRTEEIRQSLHAAATVNTVLPDALSPCTCVHHLTIDPVMDVHDHSCSVNTTPQVVADGQSSNVDVHLRTCRSEHSKQLPFGWEELLSAEYHADSDSHRQEVLDSVVREFDDFIKSEPGQASCSTTTDEDGLKSLIVNHLLFPHIIFATVACYKVGTTAEEEETLDILARLFSPMDDPMQNLEDKSSSLGKDPRLDLCLEKYLHLLREFKMDIEKVAASAATFCEQMKQKVLIQCPELDDSSGPVQSESGSFSVNPDDLVSPKEVEEMSFQDSENASDSAISTQTRAQLLPDDEWRGALLATFGPTTLKNLKKKHLKEGRKNAKLPDSSRRLLIDWWRLHAGNPYPNEEEKLLLAKQTGLEIDQINNWFINQRKRHCCSIFSQKHNSHAPDCYKVTAPRR